MKCLSDWNKDDRLPNGATLLDVEPAQAGGFIVLARWIGGRGDEYITWRAFRPDLTDTEDGHYFPLDSHTFADALADYKRRITGENQPNSLHFAGS